MVIPFVYTSYVHWKIMAYQNVTPNLQVMSDAHKKEFTYF